MGLKLLWRAAGLGAAAMYFLDPESGRRRRAMVRDQLVGLCNFAGRTWEAAKDDVTNRATGVRHEVEHLFDTTPVPDDKLVQRIRSRLGHLVYNPSEIDVAADQGRVTLRGTIASNEVECAVHAVRWFPGVQHVENQLEVRPATDAEFEFARGGLFNPQSWTPSTQVGATLGASALLLYGTLFRRPFVSLLGSAAMGLATASCTTSGSQKKSSHGGTGTGEWGAREDREEAQGHEAEFGGRAEFGRTEQTGGPEGTQNLSPGSAGPIAQPVLEGSRRPLVGEGHPHHLSPTGADEGGKR